MRATAAAPALGVSSSVLMLAGSHCDESGSAALVGGLERSPRPHPLCWTGYRPARRLPTSGSVTPHAPLRHPGNAASSPVSSSPSLHWSQPRATGNRGAASRSRGTHLASSFPLPSLPLPSLGCTGTPPPSVDTQHQGDFLLRLAIYAPQPRSFIHAPIAGRSNAGVSRGTSWTHPFPSRPDDVVRGRSGTSCARRYVRGRFAAVGALPLGALAAGSVRGTGRGLSSIKIYTGWPNLAV